MLNFIYSTKVKLRKVMLIQKGLSTYGVTIAVGSGVVSIQGFLTAFIGEVFKVASRPTEDSFGMVVNLCRDETMNLLIGSLIFNPDLRVAEGAKVTALSRLASILLGDYVIDSILDPLGNLLLNTKSVDAQYRWVIESPAPGIVDRQSVFEPLQTGIISIDAMVPIGLGQRELIVGDRQTGKTSIGVDTVLNQKHDSVLAVYVPIGQKAVHVRHAHVCFCSSHDPQMWVVGDPLLVSRPWPRPVLLLSSEQEQAGENQDGRTATYTIPCGSVQATKAGTKQDRGPGESMAEGG